MNYSPKYEIGTTWNDGEIRVEIIGVRPSPKNGLPFYRLRRSTDDGRSDEVNARESALDRRFEK